MLLCCFLLVFSCFCLVVSIPLRGCIFLIDGKENSHTVKGKFWVFNEDVYDLLTLVITSVQLLRMHYFTLPWLRGKLDSLTASLRTHSSVFPQGVEELFLNYTILNLWKPEEELLICCFILWQSNLKLQNKKGSSSTSSLKLLLPVLVVVSCQRLGLFCCGCFFRAMWSSMVIQTVVTICLYSHFPYVCYWENSPGICRKASTERLLLKVKVCLASTPNKVKECSFLPACLSRSKY